MNKKSFSVHPSDTVHRASKRFGQNFLTDRQTINRIIDAVDPTADQTILEIGPGKGALTNSLVDKAKRVIAVEFDRQLIPLLTEQYATKNNFTLIESDALVTDICQVIKPASKARVVANLPYNISTAILQRLIEQRECLTDMTLMLQKEVVERITAPAGTSERGYLSVLVEAYCTADKLFDVAPGAFRPVPKVWSSVVRLTFKPQPAANVKDEELFWRIVSAGFAQRRKTILNNLRSAPSPLQERLKECGGASIVLCRAEVDLQRRAETLTLHEWSRIARAMG
jgi:16S rRNA (adenine1518-N6/adenine1519-N6)-dimethyltransferase